VNTAATLAVMLLRIRWFLLGAATAFGLGAYVYERVRRTRERFTPRAAARASATGLADALDSVARRIAPPAG
jgi:hypothetical protein